MDNRERVYRDLQKYLDRLPGGFPEVESGLDIKLLKRFFTPEEANIAMQLSMKPEPLQRIYGRVRKNGITIEELRQILDRMMRKGTILTVEEGYRETHYCNAEFAMGGIFNFQINRLSKELLADYHQYMAERRSKASPGSGGGLPLRTIPVEASIPLPEKYRVSDYDSVRKLIENARGQIAVANCICRQTTEVLGGKCARTDLVEACLIIGPDHAKRHVEMGIGRYVSKEEAFGILSRAQQAGLVLQPENSKRPEAICCCCGDCCVLLKMLNKHPRPVELYVTNFYAEVDRELCTGCEVCVEKCQLNAREMVDGIAEINLDRCIGCGNCVVLCPVEANKMRKKEPEKVPPKDKATVNMKALAGKVGGWNMLKIRAKMLLGLKV
jgi:Na+-translocating ferredoxin:NAD+ oxidoreductase subunit B